MTALRILHVDDEPDIRELVGLSLSLDPHFTVRSCSSGIEALEMASDWMPDMILCDVMMPRMDGPATLAKLRQCPQTTDIPVVFMTARAQARELEHLKSLGAAGVIPKPFDPIQLPTLVRDQLRSAGIGALCESFGKRLRFDANTLAAFQVSLIEEGASRQTLESIKAFAHALAGAAGIFGYAEVSTAAAALEEVAIDQLLDDNAPSTIEDAITVLLSCLNRA